jgi:hypothetical protein
MVVYTICAVLLKWRLEKGHMNMLDDLYLVALIHESVGEGVVVFFFMKMKKQNNIEQTYVKRSGDFAAWRNRRLIYPNQVSLAPLFQRPRSSDH